MPRPYDSISRRDVLKTMAGTVAGLSASGRSAVNVSDVQTADILIDAVPQHELSPYLFMQFMEPLGATDGSIEAAWDHERAAWREDLVEVTRQLSPTMIRWGGCFSSYYRWKEAVGPRDNRKPMYNLLWGGIESNQVGTAEFVDFCRMVGSSPLMCVNFESDGRQRWMKDPAGQSRFADANEAAEWVRYCNDPNDVLRTSHGNLQPHPIKMWQIGNETSYDKKGFAAETAAVKTVEFARAMRKADPEIELIGWGDSGWAPQMLKIAGEHLQYMAFHHMFDPDDQKNPVLRGELYRQDPDAAWSRLMDAWKINDQKIQQMRSGLADKNIPLAMTECHFTIPGRDRCDLLSTWAAGAAYARMFNNFQRYGDVLKIATAADFCGNRWQVNAVMIPTPGFNGKSYLMPVARVMQLYRHHIGRNALNIKTKDSQLDAVASRTDETIYLHVVNTNRTKSVSSKIQIDGASVKKANMYVIAEDTTVELSHLNSDKVMQVSEKSLDIDSEWNFPAASVSAVEITLA